MPVNKLLAKLEKHAPKGSSYPPHLQSTPSSITNSPPYSGDPDFKLRTGFMNPMCDAAMSLIGLAIRLETLDECDDLEELYRLVHIHISNIEMEMQQRGYESLQVTAYSYALCLFLDEVVMLRPWGRHSSWSANPLLSEFHQDSTGGEKFFALLSRIHQEPKRYLDVLEFTYLVLCMGLKGKYALQHNGKQALEGHIAELRKIIRKHRGPLPQLFPDALKNAAPRNFRIRRYWPWWSPLLIAAGVIAGMYAYYSYRLHLVTTEVLNSLNLILQQ